ncbi:MAG: hypothetical protein AB4368_13735 [Xenococcaceae cyanobacterium]
MTELNNQNQVNNGVSVINDAVNQLADQAASEAYEITVETGLAAIEQVYRYRVSEAVQKAVNEVINLAVEEGNSIVAKFEDTAVSNIIGLEKQLQIPQIEAKKLSLRKSSLLDRLNAARANESEMKLIENASDSDVESWISGE